MIGIYTIGLFLPSINSKNALIGATTGLIVVFWVSFKAQFDIASGALTFDTKPTSIDGCTYTFNMSTVTNSSISSSSFNTFSQQINDNVEEESSSKPLHHLSYMYYTLFGAAITLIVSLLSSLVLGWQDPKSVSPVLLAPFMRKYYTKESTLGNLPLTPSDVSCTTTTTYNFDKEKLTTVEKDENEEKMKA